MSRKVSIGTVQPLLLKWTSFLLLVGCCGFLAASLAWLAKPGHGVGLALLALMFTYTCFRILGTANVYVCGTHFVIEHALKGTRVKAFAIYCGVEASSFLPHKVVFSDGTSCYLWPRSTGSGRALALDGHAYAHYVRGLMSAQGTATG